jgi:hypothetical protein
MKKQKRRNKMGVLTRKRKDLIKDYIETKKKIDALEEKRKAIKILIENDEGLDYGTYEFDGLAVDIEWVSQMKPDYPAMVKALGKRAEKMKKKSEFMRIKYKESA